MLRGHVGNVRLSKVGERFVCNFSVATNSIRRNAEGRPEEETTWHTCVAWSSNKRLPDLSTVTVGAPVEVEGSFRNNKYVGMDGVERTSQEISVNSLVLLPPEERLLTPAL